MKDERGRRARPLLSRGRLMVAVNADTEHELRCARDYGLGVEVQRFALPEVLSSDYEPELERMAARLAGLRGPIGSHGPFIDTCHYSPDPEIRAVCRRRYLKAFDIAERLGAGYVLFHSQYNTMLKLETYPDIYHEMSLRFWPEIIETAERRRIAIYIENMFDTDPAAMVRLAEAVGSPWFRLCLDIAHSQIHGTLDVAEWIDAFAPYLAHVHLNDCRGVYDDHLGLGEGSLDIERALKLLKKTGKRLTYALETNTHTRASLRFLGIARR